MGERLPGFEDVAASPVHPRPTGRVVRVRPDITSVNKAFDYVVPENWKGDGRAEKVAVGSLVRVDFNGRRTAGWVVDVDVEPSGDVAVLPLSKWSSVGPPPELIELAEWAAWRWAGRVPHFLRAASPPKMVLQVRAPIAPSAVTPSEVALGAFDSEGVTLAQLPPSDQGVELAVAAASFGAALILTPTIADRQSIAAALRAAGVDAAEYPDQWEKAAAGAVTVGTRLAAWAPLPSVDAVLVLDEHDHTYKEERTPSWNARDVAVERARLAGAPCVLASPSPSLESLEASARRLVPDRKVERESWPVVHAVDLRASERSGLLSDSIVDAVRADAPVVCILNRKGRAQMLACATCDSLASCDNCGSAVVQPDRQLECRSCGTSRPVVCRDCGGTKMKLIRPGISRLAEELRALAKRSVIEVSAETPHRDLTGNQLMIGTEALLHRVPSASSVIFLDFDQELAQPRSRAAEDAFALLALAARRVGPRDRGGRLYIQTRKPDDTVVQAALHGDAGRVARAQRDVRKVFGQPPYGAWAVLSGAGAEVFAESLDGTAGLTLRRLGDRWRVEAADHATLLDAIAATARPAERLRLEVDPVDL